VDRPGADEEYLTHAGLEGLDPLAHG